ncbi:MAG: ribose ABC transporter substrate-binding protein RbsB [Veillonellaceae bacterium]|nr:ribose ABC transporter substrate-binding protein RbsB [Veillonellaceae bacterium]
MKKIVSFLLIALAALNLLLTAGCGSKEPAYTGPVIGFSVSTLNNPFFVAMKDGVEKQAAALGIKVKIVDAQNDPAKQANDMEDLIESGVSVLIVNPVDSAAISPSVEDANEAGIPVITLDRSAEKGKVTTHIASDNFKGGQMAANLIAEKVGPKAITVELEGTPGASATRERGAGFDSIAKQKLDLVASQSADFDRTKGLNVATNLIQAHPNLQAIFAQNDEMALGAVEAAKSAGKKLFIVGFDGTTDGVKAVEDGDMAATIAQQPELMGKIAIDTAMKIIKGQAVPSKIPVPLKIVMH